jgi:hypothetical protein
MKTIAMIAALALVSMSLEARAAKIGPEIEINTHLTDHQQIPAIARLSNGGFVVAWQSLSQDGSGYGVYAQRYDAEGVPGGCEFRVNRTLNLSQGDPSAAGLEGGGFVIVWTSSGGQDGAAGGIFGQRYDFSGARVGQREFRVNTYRLDDQSLPTVAGLKGGGFVVAWASNGQDQSFYGVYAQRYDAGGARIGTPFRVNTDKANYQWYPAAAGLQRGGFVIVWQSLGQDGSNYGIYGQRYRDDGTRAGGEFKVNTTTLLNQQWPSVAALRDGGFVVVWQSLVSGASWEVLGQRYALNGAPVGAEFEVSTTPTGATALPVVAALSDGGFVATWGAVGGVDIAGQGFDASGAPRGTEFTVNRQTGGDQMFPAIAGLDQRRFIVTWQSDRGSNWEVRGQICRMTC